MGRTTHAPSGDPCARCGLPRGSHAPEHWPLGNPCERCALPAHQHPRTRGIFPREKKSGVRLKRPPRPKTGADFVGVDGEGQGRGPHRYTMMAACSADGSKRWSTAPSEELRTEECLEFLLALPASCRTFAYGFQYDLTKMLRELPTELLYSLFRPETRLRGGDSESLAFPLPIRWRGYKINLQGARFSVARGMRRRVVWDVLKFYQTSFVKMLVAWKVGTKEERDEIAYMKAHRGEFEHFPRTRVLEYSLRECRLLAVAVQKLIAAHADAGLELEKFYGAGTTSGLILDRMGIKDRKREVPPEIRTIVGSAFFGGRFEHSVVGPVGGEDGEKVWGYDISSAYPYQTRFLPCLDHGTWRKTRERRDLGGARGGLVHYRLHPPRTPRPWAPFPFRISREMSVAEQGSICFPSSSGGGWIHLEEYLAGEALFDNVEFLEAWVLDVPCDCVPFSEIPKFYVERCRIGKEGAGIVLKLGPNGVYGKLAQSVGREPPYQSWYWAGRITAGTRAQMLSDVFAAHRDLHNLLAIATDGAYTRERLLLPRPRETGTGPDVLRDEFGQVADKPLGGWEEKATKHRVFFARPGIYFEHGLSEEQMRDVVRARGIGRGDLVRHAPLIERTWAEGKTGITLPGELERFVGAKSGTHLAKGRAVASADLGQWVKRPITLDFAPLPKRSGIVREDGVPYGKLTLRSFPMSCTSAPYDNAVKSVEACDLARAQVWDDEQPDPGELSDPEGWWET